MSLASCLVVGAGIAGLLAGQRLQAAGLHVTVVDKARGVGGRMATRRLERDGEPTAVFDHGAQFFTVREDRFAALVENWQAEGIIEQWSSGFATADGSYYADGHPRYRGAPGMTAIAKHLARGLDVRLGTRPAAVRHDGQGWTAATEGGETFSADALLLTPPVPQSLALLAAGQVALPPEIGALLGRVRYEPCIALLLLLDGPGRVPEPGGLWPEGEPIAWLADNHRKGVSPRPGAITIHGGPVFSQAYWSADERTITAELLASAAPWLGDPVLASQVQRWRYSKPNWLHPEACLAVKTPSTLVFAGDAFAGPRVEGAALSGLAAADWLEKFAGI